MSDMLLERSRAFASKGGLQRFWKSPEERADLDASENERRPGQPELSGMGSRHVFGFFTPWTLGHVRSYFAESCFTVHREMDQIANILGSGPEDQSLLTSCELCAGRSRTRAMFSRKSSFRICSIPILTAV
jgi:hypothetical protein